MPLSATRVQDIFNNLTSPSTSSQYWDHVSPTVHWTVSGSTPISGVYNTKDAFRAATIAFLGRDVLTAPLRLQPVHVHVSPATPTSGTTTSKTAAIVEMQAIDAECQNGLKYDMRYCWVCTFDDSTETIEEVRAYLDTDLLRRAIEQNKK